jgi:TonB-dependent receptor
MYTNIKKVLIFTYFLFLTGTLIAQTGSIKGEVIDSHTGDPLPGATAYIKEHNLGAASNLDGEYFLNNVPVGTQSVTFNFLGYKELSLDVDIRTEEVIILNADLEFLTIQSEEIVITAQAQGQRAAINQQFSSNTITNVVSAEKMEQLPDANAAEALGRLPGISLKRSSGEADKIVIRGLSPKYNNVTIEGIKMASTSDFDRSVDLSLVQSELLSGVEVSKSLRPDMDADALGGTVNLRIAAAPDKRKMNLMVEGGYADLTGDIKNYKVMGGISDRFLDKKIGASLKITNELKQMPSHRFNAGYGGTFRNGDGILQFRTQNVSLVDRAQTRKRTNASLVLDYSSSWLDMKFFNTYSQKNDDVINRNNTFVFLVSDSPSNFTKRLNEEDWKTITRTHALQNRFSYGNSILDFNLSTTISERNMNDQSFPFIEINLPTLEPDWLIYQDPQKAFSEIGGPDSLSLEDTYLQSFILSNQKLTDESYDVRIDYEISYALSNNINGKLKFGGKYHQLDRKSDGTERYSDFQWGGSVARRQALLNQFPDITTDINSQRGISAHNFVDEGYNPGEFLYGRYQLGWGADIDMLTDLQDEYFTGSTDNKYYLSGSESYVRDYNATEKLSAAYMMTELNLGRKLMILPGIRYEKNETEYFAYHIKASSGLTGIAPNPDSITVNRSNEHWFPSINIKYKPTDFINIQGAVYKSTSRPSFRQISPMVIYPNTENRIQSNNPYLQPSNAWNYDLGLSIMDTKLGLFTVYAFYKEIKDLIFVMNNYIPSKKGSIVGGPEDLDERILGAEYYDDFYLTAKGSTNLPFNNPEKSTVKGLEFSWQTNLWYLPGILQGLVLDINYTLVDTRTAYPYFTEVTVGIDSSGFIPQPIKAQQYETKEGALEDQPGHIINIILGWDYKDFSARVSYRYQAGTLGSQDSRYSIRDQYYADFSLIDFMLKQKITNRISTYLNLTNIGNHIDDYYYSEQGPERPAMPTRSEYYGFRAQLGFKFNL